MKGLRAISLFLLAGLLLAGCGAAARESDGFERTLMSESAPAEPMAEGKLSADAASGAGFSADNAAATLPSMRMVRSRASMTSSSVAEAKRTRFSSARWDRIGLTPT